MKKSIEGPHIRCITLTFKSYKIGTIVAQIYVGIHVHRSLKHHWRVQDYNQKPN